MATTFIKKFEKFGTLGRSSKKPKSDLRIRIKGEKAKEPYHCVWPPFCATQPDIAWASLTTHEVTFNHIRVYELSGTDSLSVFVAFLEQLSSVPSTRAIVVINTVESYDLDAKFSTDNYRDTPVPVVVVKRKTGEKLLKQVEKYGRDLEASIEGGKEGETEEGGGTDTLERGKDKKSKKNREDKGSPLLDQRAVTLPRARDPESETHGKVGVAGGVAEGGRRLSLEFGTRDSIFAGPKTGIAALTAATAMATTHPADRESPVTAVKNGLKVRIKSQPDSTTREYDYVPAPFCSSLRSVLWSDICTTEATYPHLRLHQLPSSSSSSQLDDDLSFFFSTVASLTANLALVLINPDNSFNLAGKLQSLPEDQIPLFPVVIVTKETGTELMQLLNEHFRDVEAMIELPLGKRDSISTPSSPPGSPACNSLSTTIVKKGLKLRLQSSPSEELQFDYISAPFSLSLRSVNWVRLSHCEATSPHVRLHQLREEDSLSFFMSMLSSIPATLAVVLVNHRDGYKLSERLSARSEGGCSVPMVVVTRETGRELERLLRENDRAVEVKIELASKTNPSPALSRSLSANARDRVTTDNVVSPASSHHKPASITHSIIKEGLEVHDGSKTHFFDFSWCSFNQTSVRPFQSRPLTLYEATFPHYRLHKLTHEDSLRFFMAMMESIPATLAVVLVNFDNSYRLSEKFVSAEGEIPPVPVILVTNETGLELARLLEENPRDVKAVIHTQTPDAALIRDPHPPLTASPEYGDVRGLHVKIGVMGAVVDYTYVPGPYRQEVGDIDWICLTSVETTFPHIRIHDLKKEDSLSYFMSTMASTPAALAVVFVNSEDHFRLADKFKSEDQSPPVPVLVVTRQTGSHLLKLVEQNPREVYMKVDRLSLQDVVERGGLQVRLSDKNSHQKPRKTSFDFVWAPSHQIPRAVAWQPLALHETTFPHLRLHRLTENDDLGDFLALMSSIPATLALVLVNPASHYRLSEKLASSLQTPPVPVVVVTRETGRELARLLEEHPRELEARIETALKGPLSPSVSSTTSPSRSLLFSMHPPASGVMNKGLEVKLTRTEEKRFFNFAWAPFCDSPVSLDWLGLAHHQVTYEHIQIHQLKSDQSISFILSTLGSLTSARALLLVNTYDGYELDERFRPQSEGPCLPTMVVSRRTGAELMELLKIHERDVEVKVHRGGLEEEGEGEGGEVDEWEVITSAPPSSDDVPTFQSVTESIATHNVITDGLVVRLKKKKSGKSLKFDYIWASFCSARREIDMTPLHLSSALPKSSVSSSLPKTSSSGCVCLHDLRKDRSRDRYNSLLKSPFIQALILVNTCDSYKISQELTVQTQTPVLVVTRSTGDALSSLMRDQPEVRVAFGGTDEEGEGTWVVEGGVENTLPLEVPPKLEWEDCTPRSSDIAEKTVSVAEMTDRESEAQSSSGGERGKEREGAVVMEVEGRESPQPEPSGGRGVREEEKKEEEEEEGEREEQRLAAYAGGSNPQEPGTEVHFDQDLEQSLSEFVIVGQTEGEPPPPPLVPTASSTPSQPSLPSQTSFTGQPSLPLTPMDTLQGVPSLTPTGASSSLGLGGEDSSLCGTPTMLPPQEIVPYNAGPYTGPGSELSESLLNQVSITGATVTPGDDVPALKTTSSKNIDLKKPIHNGLRIRPVDIQGQDNVSQRFTYQWSRTTDSPQRMAWLSLTDQSDYPEQHVRLFKLEKDSDLQLLMAMLDTSSAAGLLLVNRKNSYDIDRNYFPPGEQVWPVPIMVVTSDTGEKIRNLMKTSPASGVEVKVEIEAEPSPKPQKRGLFGLFY